MRVLVVGIVSMNVLMLHRLVPVLMHVPLSQVQPHAHSHQNGRRA